MVLDKLVGIYRYPQKQTSKHLFRKHPSGKHVNGLFAVGLLECVRADCVSGLSKVVEVASNPIFPTQYWGVVKLVLF